MIDPSRSRRLAAIAIDVGFLAVVAPLLALGAGLLLAWPLYWTAGDDCLAPCDGPGMTGVAFAFTALAMVWLTYWPVLIFWRRSTIGSRIVGLRYEGSGIRRRLVWRTGRPHVRE